MNLRAIFNFFRKKMDQPLVFHKGVYKPIASVPEAIFMITGMTIGAGVLGLPYVVAEVGLWVGLASILFLGAVFLCLNLMIGEIAVHTKGNLQIPGLAGKYLGNWAKNALSIAIILSSLGALLAYIIGEGQSLSAIFGGYAWVWSVFFWLAASVAIWRGLLFVKTAEKFLGIAVIGIIFGLSLYLLPHFNLKNTFVTDWSKFFLPFGVILFALNATPSIIEAHALLPRSQRHFRKAVIWGTVIPIIVYLIFSLAVVGIEGKGTTELATLGLGLKFGPIVLLLANIFAILAMGTASIGLGTALKETLIWDNKLDNLLAEVLVFLVPLTLFILGIRSFVLVLDVVGGFLVSFEAIIIVLTYLKAKNSKGTDISRYGLHHFLPMAAMVLVVFLAAAAWSIVKLFL